MRALALAAALLAASAAAAAEWRAAGEQGAILFDGPSRQATPLFVVSKDYPLEVIVELEAWAKVRDHTGAVSWVEKQMLSTRRMVLVTEAGAAAHERPEEGAPIAFSAAANVVLELVEVGPGGWLRVRHADGADGYLRATAAWGD